jgi:protein-tyrosine phosphatase
VTDRVAVGGDDYLQSPALVSLMKAGGITHVLDCRAEAKLDAKWFSRSYRPEHKEAFTAYLNNGFEDDFARKGIGVFRKALDFALGALSDPDHKLYVHCALGYNRGPSMAYAVLRATGLSEAEALHAIVSNRQVGLAYRDDAEHAVRVLRLVDEAPLRQRRSRK